MRPTARCLLFLPVLESLAALINRTIDDQYGDNATGLVPVYLPSYAWHQGNSCFGCGIYPGPARGGVGAAVDLTQAFDQSWHDSTYIPGQPPSNISIHFAGEAVYVYNTIANAVAGVTTLTHLVFTLDGMDAGRYIHVPDPGEPELLYRVAVYANSSIPYGRHTLVIEASGESSSLILFDYAIYSVDDSAASPSAISTPHLTQFGPETAPLPSATRMGSPALPDKTSPSSASAVDDPTHSSPATTPLHILSNTVPRTTGTIDTSHPTDVSLARSLVLKSPAFIGGVAAGSAFGLILILALIVALRRLRKYRNEARAPLPFTRRRPGIATEALRSPFLPGFGSTLPARPQPSGASNGFSVLATWPESRFTLPGSSNSPTIAPSSVDENHSARLRLFHKISAVSRMARTQSMDRERPTPLASRCTEGEHGDAPPRSVGNGHLRSLMEDVAALRACVEELPSHRRDSPILPPMPGGGHAASTSET